MSGADHSLALRRAVIAALRADHVVAGMVGDRIFDAVPAQVPRPYLRYGVPIIGPFEATGVVGSDIDVTIHVFDEGQDGDRAHRLMMAVQIALDEKPLTLEDSYLLWMTWTGSQPLTDQKARQHYHGIVQFNAVTGEA